MRKLLLLLLAIALQLSAATREIEDLATTPILTPAFKQRQTRKLELENGIQVLLVSDQGAEASSALLAVRAGSWDEPADQQGLAHFLEHMLFLGNSKYPEEGEYQRFMERNGGSSNAFTASDFTAYMFAVNHDAFNEAVDRLSWFFREPLFNPSGVKREMNAVHQEWKANIENDGWRSLAVRRELSNTAHPGSRFNVGNLETLAEISQERLQQWYRDYYTTEQMVLMFYSSESLDALQTLAEEKFGVLARTERKELQVDVPYFNPSLAGKRVVIQPIKDMRQLQLTWELPARYARTHDTWSGSVVGHILGHEGERSLLAQLKREGLALGLSAGQATLARSNAFLSVRVDLTPLGLSSVDTVIERVYQAIASVRAAGDYRAAFEEMQKMARIEYQFQERMPAFRTAYMAAHGIMSEGIASFPERSAIPSRYAAEEVEEILSLLTPERAHTFLLAQATELGVQVDKKEYWYDVPYAVQAQSEELIARWSAAKQHPLIGLEERNPYLPENLSLTYQGEPQELKSTPVPQLLIDNDRGSLYFLQDTHYLTPEIEWSFKIVVPQITPENPRSFALGDLYTYAVREALNSEAYSAQLAGLSYAVTRSDDSIVVNVSGYPEKADLLFAQILKTLREVQPSAEQFAIYKEALQRSYRNVEKEGPLKLGMETLREVLYKDFVDYRQLITASEYINVEDLVSFRDSVFEHSYVKGLCYGNMQSDDARRIWRQLQKSLAGRPFPKDAHYDRETVYLEPSQGPYMLRNSTEQRGNAVILMLQHGAFDYERETALEILTKWVESPFYEALRTQQQTAYIVWNWDQDLEKQLYSFFAVLSNSHDGRDLLARFELVIETFIRELQVMTDAPEEFETIRSSLIRDWKETPRSMSDMARRLWALCYEHDGDFDRIDKRIDGLGQLSWERFKELADEFYGRQNRSRLAVITHGKIVEQARFEYIKMRSEMQLKRISDYRSRREVER